MYRTGTTLEDKRMADLIFRINMYILIHHNHPFDPYTWKRLAEARKKIANLYYWAVATYGEAAFFAV